MLYTNETLPMAVEHFVRTAILKQECEEIHYPNGNSQQFTIAKRTYI